MGGGCIQWEWWCICKGYVYGMGWHISPGYAWVHKGGGSMGMQDDGAMLWVWGFFDLQNPGIIKVACMHLFSDLLESNIDKSRGLLQGGGYIQWGLGYM